VVLMPPDGRAASTVDDGSTEGLLRALAMLRDFQFRWLVIVRQNVFVHVDRLMKHVMANDCPLVRSLPIGRRRAQLVCASTPWIRDSL